MAKSVPVQITVGGQTVMADKYSITQSEYFQASGYGMKPQAMYKIASALYQGEDRLIADTGEVLAIYRTYTSGDRIELYTERRAGIR